MGSGKRVERRDGEGARELCRNKGWGWQVAEESGMEGWGVR